MYSSCTPETTLEEQIAYCARVSNPTSQENALNNDKLIRYLIQHKHWSPFEMVNICLEIESKPPQSSRLDSCQRSQSLSSSCPT